MVIRRTVLMLGAAHLGAMFPLSSRADLYDDYITSKSKQPFVAFLARLATVGKSDSTIGHAFVGVGVRLNATLIVYERLFGLYPKDGVLAAVKSVIGPKTGKLDKTWNDITWATELRRNIDDTQKAKVIDQFNKWSSAAPNYSLVANGGINCNGLVADVAGILGMKVPGGAGTTRPWKYIEALKAANPQ